MKSLFRGYIPYTDEEIAALWKECVFSFDTNVLLNAYRCSKPTVAKILEVLGKLKGRVWLTHQAAWEFISKRDSIAYAQIGIFKSAAAAIQKLAQDFKVEKNEQRRDALIDFNSIREDIAKSTTSLLEKIEKARQDHADWLKEDPALRLYCSLFEGCTGEKPSKEDHKQMEELCTKRKADKVPPGFNDDGLGDGLIWQQLIGYAKTNKKPIIFVTDDAKDDWWSKVSGETIRPHPSLTQEMYAEAGVDFYMYPMHRFIEEAGRMNQVLVEQNVIKEIEKVEERPSDSGTAFDELSFGERWEVDSSRVSDLARAADKLGEFQRTVDRLNVADRAAELRDREQRKAFDAAKGVGGLVEAERRMKDFDVAARWAIDFGSEMKVLSGLGDAVRNLKQYGFGSDFSALSAALGSIKDYGLGRDLAVLGGLSDAVRNLKHYGIVGGLDDAAMRAKYGMGVSGQPAAVADTTNSPTEPQAKPDEKPPHASA